MQALGTYGARFKRNLPELSVPSLTGRITGTRPSYSSYLHHLWKLDRQCVQKRWRLQFRRRWITQMKEHSIQSTAKVWNQEKPLLLDALCSAVCYECHTKGGWIETQVGKYEFGYSTNVEHKMHFFFQWFMTSRWWFVARNNQQLYNFMFCWPCSSV